MDITVTFQNPAAVPDFKMKYVVIAARCQDKWVFCRHKARATWEIPGGHIEPGETPADAARRELYEETGATDADIRCVSIYGVERSGVTTYGMLYFAEIKTLGALPADSEIGEIQLLDALPENLTYPAIQPHLYHHVQCWRNLQTSADELWDVYDESRNLTGRLHRRGDYLEHGDYHLVVHVWLQNSKGEFLLTKRTPNKGYPNMWESTGGSALAGDDSLTAALREVKEETGLTADPSKGKCVITYRREDAFADVWLFHQDFDLDDVVLLEGETCGKMYASIAQIREMRKSQQIVPFPYLEQLLEMVEGEQMHILQGIHATNDYERRLFGAAKEQFSDNLYRWYSDVRPDHYNSNFFTPIADLTRQDIEAVVAFQKQRGLNEVIFSTNRPLDLRIMEGFDCVEYSAYVMALLSDRSHLWQTNGDIEIRDIQTHDIRSDILDVSDVPEKHRAAALRNMQMVLEVAKTHSEYHWFCAYKDGKRVGTAYAVEHNGFVEMDDLWVEENYRHQRIATTIMKHIVDHTDGIVYLHATANATPKDMYAKMGFEIVETVYEYYLEW